MTVIYCWVTVCERFIKTANHWKNCVRVRENLVYLVLLTWWKWHIKTTLIMTWALVGETSIMPALPCESLASKSSKHKTLDTRTQPYSWLTNVTNRGLHFLRVKGSSSLSLILAISSYNATTSWDHHNTWCTHLQSLFCSCNISLSVALVDIAVKKTFFRCRHSSKFSNHHLIADSPLDRCLSSSSALSSSSSSCFARPVALSVSPYVSATS